MTGDPVADTDAWFLTHGLAYFVPEKRAEAKRALRPGRTVPFVAGVGLLAAAAGGLLAWATGEFSAAPAALVSLGLAAVAWYLLTAVNARPIVGWALGRTFGSLRMLLPMMTRALPLLLVFVTFLFINAEVWEVAANLQTGMLWLTALLFGGLATGFLLVRLPEEVDLVDDEVDEAFLRRACAGTPMERSCHDLIADPDADPASYAQVSGFERVNLVLVLLIIQAVQILLLAVTVFAFFVLFGAMVIELNTQVGWTGIAEKKIVHLPKLVNVSIPLVQVSLFLASFSALYLTVSTVTDETYREQFFGSVMREMERAVGVRAVYLALRDRRPVPDA
ncbi:MAG: hypothetical protein JWM84_3207 [Nocardioides sp.]|nr:hypothetical protein [Nocardioides sp.]